MLKEVLCNVREKHPLIHNITNYVTVNDCANILLACGGSPIMSDDIEEVEEITTICGGLNINIGTLNQRTIPAMLRAGKKPMRWDIRSYWIRSVPVRRICGQRRRSSCLQKCNSQ